MAAIAIAALGARTARIRGLPHADPDDPPPSATFIDLEDVRTVVAIALPLG